MLWEKFGISNEKSSEIVGKTRIPLEKFDIRHGNHQKRSEKFDICNRNHRKWSEKLGFHQKSNWKSSENSDIVGKIPPS